MAWPSLLSPAWNLDSLWEPVPPDDGISIPKGPLSKCRPCSLLVYASCYSYEVGSYYPYFIDEETEAQQGFYLKNLSNWLVPKFFPV